MFLMIASLFNFSQSFKERDRFMKMRALYFTQTNQTLNKDILLNHIEDVKSTNRYKKNELLRYVGILAKEYLVMQEDKNLHLCIEKLTDLCKYKNLVDREIDYLFKASLSCNRTYAFRYNFIKTLFERDVYHASISQFSARKFSIFGARYERRHL